MHVQKCKGLVRPSSLWSGFVSAFPACGTAEHCRALGTWIPPHWDPGEAAMIHRATERCSPKHHVLQTTPPLPRGMTRHTAWHAPELFTFLPAN